MPRRLAYYSILRDTHHDNTGCAAGANIDPDNWRLGEGRRPLCKRCLGLDEKERRSMAITERALPAERASRRNTPAVEAPSRYFWLGGWRF